MSKNIKSQRLLRVFLCHSSGDKQAVRELYVQLRSDGLEPWLDEEKLLAGQDWQQEIPKAVRQADAVIVCLSRSSINKAGYVQKEIKYALDMSDEQPEGTIFIIPLRLEDCIIPERLRRWHWIDLFDPKGYERLIAALRFRADTLGIEIIPIRNKADEMESSQVELYLTEVVHRTLLPAYPPKTNSLEIATMYYPTSSIAADYYDFIHLNDSEFGIVIADVSGKGMAAVLLASTLRVVLRVLASSGIQTLSRLVELLNRQMSSLIEKNQFATLFYAQYEEESKLFTYVNAGHNSPVLVRSNSNIESNFSEHQAYLRKDYIVNQQLLELRKGGALIGAFPYLQYEQETIILQTGDVLVVYTDGLTEAANSEGEPFGEIQLHQVIGPLVHLTAKEIGDKIIASVDAWRSEIPLYDDLTVIVIKVK